MKILFALIIVFFSLKAHPQLVEIKGYALDTLKNNNFVVIAVNDTLNKYVKQQRIDDPPETYHEIRKRYTTSTKKDGSFTIQAKLEDSLHFSSNMSFTKYIPQMHSVKDLIAMEKIKIELVPEKCIKYVKCEDENYKFYAFVGEVIEVKETDETYYCNYITLDYKYKAKLKILHEVYGNYIKDTIEFTAYDHYGRPNFANYTHVLIYVAEHCKKLYHTKYQFSPVYRVEGKWATPYYNSNRTNSKIYLQKARPIKFPDNASYTIHKNLADSVINARFQLPYFLKKDTLIKPLYGYYTEDFFEIMKQTNLKELGYFDNK